MNSYNELREFCKELYTTYSPERIEKLIFPLIKRNIYKEHAEAQIICQKYLEELGYKVELEKRLTPQLVCDVFAVKDGEKLIVEIEANKGNRIRETSKVTRYSNFADIFVLGLPSTRKPMIYKELLKEPRLRSEEKMRKIKEELDKVYRNPPIEYENLKNSKLNLIYLIDTEKKSIEEKCPLDFF